MFVLGAGKLFVNVPSIVKDVEFGAGKVVYSPKGSILRGGKCGVNGRRTASMDIRTVSPWTCAPMKFPAGSFW